MKWQGLLVISIILACAGLGLLIFQKREEELILLKNSSFLEIKVRVSTDVLSEYQDDVTTLQADLEVSKKQAEDLKTVAEKAQADYNAKKGQLDTCVGDMKRVTDETAAVENEKKNVEDWFNGEKGKWTQETDVLKKQLAEFSKLCNFVVKTSEEGMKLTRLYQMDLFSFHAYDKR
ncbi:pollen-specific leucine-rich repeat extensin-like protein 1 [Arapaima gigas]